MKKAKEKKKLSDNIMAITVQVEVVSAFSFIDFARRYKWTISNTNINKTKKMRLIRVEKYWWHDGQIEIELD